MKRSPLSSLRPLRILALLGAAALLAACATPPAKVARARKTTGIHQPSRESALAMAELLDTALRQPNTPESADALGHFIERWKADCGEPEATITTPATAERPAKTYRVRVVAQGEGCYPADYFDMISPADDFTVRGIEHHLRSGVGTPLTALRENRHENELEKLYPPEAITRAVTAVAEPGPVRNGVQDVSIRLLCPLRNDSIRVGSRTQPLAADFSVPWAMLLSRAGSLKRSGVADVFLTRTPRRQPQLYLMEPYDPKKEPLIMIHGLLSTPLTFAELSNELWAVDAIRHRYQIWHYLYNTSAPPLYSARILRKQLREVRQILDPNGKDPASRKTTILAHSMGGIIAKALATSPGDAYWKAAFTVPPDQLKLSPEDRKTLYDAFEWKADPTIHRIIFVCVPHRGSDFADNLLSRIGRQLTAPPKPFTEFYRRVYEANPGVFTEPYRAMGEGKLDSVSSLSPRMPTLQILAQLPFAHSVQAYSIIGNRGKSGPLEQSSDGVVPYSSSHLDGVVSEIVVPSGHSALENPEALQEIKRVLMLR